MATNLVLIGVAWLLLFNHTFSQEIKYHKQITSEDTLKLEALAHSIEPYVIDVRQHLHQIPELRFEEQMTLQLIRGEIESTLNLYPIGASTEITEGMGGIWLDVTLDSTFDRLLFRADVDALPIAEETGLPYSSQNPGKMHACGHDIHAAMLLGALRALLQGIATGTVVPRHNFRLVFQRAEENPISESGGAMLVREGVCDGIAKAYGLHIWATGEPGVFESRPGRMMANSDRFKIIVHCSGGHVARPNEGSNAIDIAVAIVDSLRGFETRILGLTEPVSLVPAILQSGTGSNIRPATAEIWFAVRNHLPEDQRAAFHLALGERVRGVVSLYPDATVETTPIYGHPMLYTDTADVAHVGSLLDKNEQTVREIELLFGGEDFAHYLKKVPGSFWMLGAKNGNAGDHHTPTFNPDVRVFWKGVLFWLMLATN